MPNVPDGLPESRRPEVPAHVSVRLKITVIARVDALVPSLTPLGSKPLRSNALRALILTGLAVLEAPHVANSPPGPDNAVDAESPENPNACDGLRESPRHIKSRHVSVRLEPAVIARVDALAPRFIRLGTDHGDPAGISLLTQRERGRSTGRSRADDDDLRRSLRGKRANRGR